MTISAGQRDVGNVPSGNILIKIHTRRCWNSDSTTRGIPAVGNLRFVPRISRLLRRNP